MSNPFTKLAEEHITGPRKAQLRAAKTRAERRRQKALEDEIELHKSWKAWHKDKRDTLLAGRHAEAARALAAFLERMSLQDTEALLALVEAGPWPRADADTKYTVLSMVDAAIVHLRESAGMVPFDDAIPWSDDGPTVFQQIKELLQ